MAEVLAIVNQKGGVGKTTTSINLGSFLAHTNHPTLVIDLDPQANATSGLGVAVEENQPTLYEALIGAAPLSKAIKATRIKNLHIFQSPFCYIVIN